MASPQGPQNFPNQPQHRSAPKRTADVLAAESQDGEEGGLAWTYLAVIGLLFLAIVFLAWSCQEDPAELSGGLTSQDTPTETLATTPVVQATQETVPTEQTAVPQPDPQENITAVQSSIQQSLAETKLVFEPNKTEIASGEEVIETVAGLLKDTDYLIKVEGYTDSVGDADDNLLLSQDRAKAVRDKLVAQGVLASRIETEGFGETQATEDPSDDEKAADRRIEIKISAAG